MQEHNAGADYLFPAIMCHNGYGGQWERNKVEIGMMDAVLDLNSIQHTVSELGSQYGAERIYLFGSYARGNAGADSDVDLRIDRGDVKGLSMGGLLLDLEDSLGKKVDLLSTNCLRRDFLDSIRGEEILLYERKG